MHSLDPTFTVEARNQKEKEKEKKEGREEIRDRCVMRRHECEPIIVGSWIMVVYDAG